MVKLVWCSDVHLNFPNQYGGPYGFGEWLRDNDDTSVGCVISGDIAEGVSLQQVMKGFSEGYGKPIYFVSGNHDYYGSSWEAVNKSTAEWAIGDPHWLRKEGVIELAPDLAICGNEGW